MPSADQLLPQHAQLHRPQAAQDDYELIMAALSELPADSHQRILADFVLTARRCEITRDHAPLRRLIESLFLSAHMQRNVEYRAAVEALDHRTPDVVDMSEWLKELAARRRS